MPCAGDSISFSAHVCHAGCSPAPLKLILGGKRLQVLVVQVLFDLLLDVATSLSRVQGQAVKFPLCLLQDDSCSLKECGITGSKPILVLGAVNNEQQKLLASQEQQANQAQHRTERLDRLRKAAKALAQRSDSR